MGDDLTAGLATPVPTVLVSSIDSVQQRFIQGYRDAGGPAVYEQHLIAVIQCESGWRIEPGNPTYRGLAQFHPDTWARARRSPDADYLDPYEQGWAVGNWIRKLEASGSSPGGSGGWPYCFHVEGW